MTTTLAIEAPGPDHALSSWLEWLEYLHPSEIELGLDRVREVAAAAGLFDDLPLIITVAGTNGKGSVVAMLTSIYTQAGYTTGTYTSPHLVRFNERICINNTEVSDAAIVSAFGLIESVRRDTSLTYFEYTTLAAMSAFKSAGVDVAVLEVGLGGRLDAVNIWDTSCAIVTSIDVDHESWLGSSREQIAVEKIAVARRAKPLIVAETNPPVAIGEYAEFHDVLYWQVNRDYHYRDEGQVIRLITPVRELKMPVPALAGDHQRGNAAAAVAAIESNQALLPVETSAIDAGLLGVKLVGRFDRRILKHTKGDIEMVIDVAHNPAAAQALSASLKSIQPTQLVHAVFAMMADKDVRAVVEMLGSQVSSWHLGQLDVPRAMSAGQLGDTLRQVLDEPTVTEYDNVQSALDGAIDASADTSHSMVLVFGSFFTVTEVLRLWD